MRKDKEKFGSVTPHEISYLMQCVRKLAGNTCKTYLQMLEFKMSQNHKEIMFYVKFFNINNLHVGRHFLQDIKKVD